MAMRAYPPLAGFGEVHALGNAVRISDGTTGTVVLSLDPIEYILCPLRTGDPDPCLDGYRTRTIEGARQHYAVTPNVEVTLITDPEMYRTGGLADLRNLVATNPSNMVILQLAPSGRVIAVGQPWLP